jgi:hypothetical protein
MVAGCWICISNDPLLEYASIVRYLLYHYQPDDFVGAFVGRSLVMIPYGVQRSEESPKDHGTGLENVLNRTRQSEVEVDIRRSNDRRPR